MLEFISHTFVSMGASSAYCSDAVAPTIGGWCDKVFYLSWAWMSTCSPARTPCWSNFAGTLARREAEPRR